MPITWDPKITAAQPSVGAKHAGSQKHSAAHLTPEAAEKPAGIEQPDAAAIHPSKMAPDAGPALFEKEIERLIEGMRAQKAVRQKAADEALRLCVSYTMRRSRGARKRAIDLCDEVAQRAPENKESAECLKEILDAEGQIHEMSAPSTLDGICRLIALVERQSPKAAVSSPEHHALAHALLAQGLTQLAVHFPNAAEQMSVPPRDLLTRALSLAEQALTLDPQSADARSALGRLLLIHGDAEALDDAVEILRLAQSQSPDHDPTGMALATALRAQGKREEAAELVNQVIRRGCGLPQPFVLRAMLSIDEGDVAGAQRDLERAVMMAPFDGLVHLDAARAAEAAGDPDAAETYMARARALLGPMAEQLATEIFALDGGKPSNGLASVSGDEPR